MGARTFQRVAALLALAAALFAQAAKAECTAGPPLVGAAESTPNADFAVLPDGYALHLKTRLVWKRCAEGQTWDGSSCAGNAQTFDWSSALTRSAGATDGGSTEWRVPNRKELESIAEFCGHSPAINRTVFPNTPHERFWTSTTFQAEPNRAWDVYFSDGYVGASSKFAAQYVRLVRTLAVGELPLAQAITVGTLPAISIGAAGNVVATATSGLPVTLANTTTGICSLSGSTVTGLATGACVLTASQPGDATFAPAPALPISLDITLAAQTISFGAVPILTVGGSGTISASASSGLPVTLSSLTPAVCSLTGSTVRGIAAGTCTIAADQAGSALFGPALQIRRDIAVSSSTTPGGGDPPPPATRITVALVPGWNLIGNGGDVAFAVDDLFGQESNVASVWKWVVKGRDSRIRYPNWAFRTPTLPDRGRATAHGKGFELLNTVEPGEAFWVHARAAFSVTLPGAPLPATAFTPAGVLPALPNGGPRALERGWSLIATGEDLSPAQFHAAIGGTASKLISLWAWDAATARWLFYSPELDQRGNNVLRDYTAGRGYRDFLQSGKRLLPGTGFWVHRR